MHPYIGDGHETYRTIFAGLSCCLFLAFAQFAGAIAEAQQASNPRVADLVRAGKVRVALYLPQYTKDPVTGELQGWPIDVIRALGERLSVEGVPVEHPTPAAAIACLKSGACDVAIMGIDPARATEVDYSCPPAPRSTASQTRIGREFESRSCAIMYQR